MAAHRIRRYAQLGASGRGDPVHRNACPAKLVHRPSPGHVAASPATGLAAPSAYAMRQAGITLSISAPDSLPMVTGLSDRLEQVLVNLLNDVRDSGIINVAAQAVERAARLFVLIAVQDNGPGIPPDLLPQLFVTLVTTKPCGTGLGLRTCRRIVEEMGGRITAINRAEGGACFEVFLPSALEPRGQLSETR